MCLQAQEQFALSKGFWRGIACHNGQIIRITGFHQGRQICGGVPDCEKQLDAIVFEHLNRAAQFFNRLGENTPWATVCAGGANSIGTDNTIAKVSGG